ncbi:MAG: hypothetical protein ACI861_000322 [Paracoccaceae bacterium]|jgi:hypothetical protein
MIVVPLALKFLVLALVFGPIVVFWWSKRERRIRPETPSVFRMMGIIIVLLLLFAGGFIFWVIHQFHPVDRELAISYALVAAGLGSVFAFPILMIISLFAMARR